jgi:hypothetical protein
MIGDGEVVNFQIFSISSDFLVVVSLGISFLAKKLLTPCHIGHAH